MFSGKEEMAQIKLMSLTDMGMETLEMAGNVPSWFGKESIPGGLNYLCKIPKKNKGGLKKLTVAVRYSQDMEVSVRGMAQNDSRNMRTRSKEAL